MRISLVMSTKLGSFALLSRGAAIRVLSPQWFAQAVKQAHLDATAWYE